VGKCARDSSTWDIREKGEVKGNRKGNVTYKKKNSFPPLIEEGLGRGNQNKEPGKKKNSSWSLPRDVCVKREKGGRKTIGKRGRKVQNSTGKNGINSRSAVDYQAVPT